VVCAGIMVLRVTKPRAVRPFRTPLVWVVAPLGVAMCLFMIRFLPSDTWLRMIGWTLLGLAIYLAYGIRHARPPRWSIIEEPASQAAE